MTALIQKALEKDIISFDAEQKNITYVFQNKKRSYTTPEEKVRCLAFLELIFQYGYAPENIAFEVRAKQGASGKTSADIVVYYDSAKKKAFMVVEVKKADTSEKIDDIRKQARSYAKSEEINTQLYAYKIGEEPFKAFKTNGKDTETKIPYNYTQQTVYAYIKEDMPIPKEQAHYERLEPSTPYDLKRIFTQCHKMIWISGQKNERKALDEFNKLLFLKMYDEIQKEEAEKHLSTYFFQTSTVETPLQLKDRLVKEFDKAVIDRKIEGLFKPLDIDEYQLENIIEKLQKISLIETDKDPKGLAFETFTENYMKGEFGQYFTPRNIVEFMVNVSPITWDENFSSKSKVLDPCCGSGSFLTQAISTFKKRFRKPENSKNFANNSVFGVEINGDICISAKINLALHDDGHDNIRNANGLNISKLDWQAKRFDLILTNPPFGGQSIENQDEDKKTGRAVLGDLSRFYDYENFKITQKRFDEIEELRKKSDSKTQFTDHIRPEHIFIELYHKVLNEEGIAEIIVPDGVLTNSTNQYLRDFITSISAFWLLFPCPNSLFRTMAQV